MAAHLPAHGPTNVPSQAQAFCHPPAFTQAQATLADPRWSAVIARDRAADGRYVYAVRTTGVFCRPSCGARRARPENVEFHATGEDARRAGFRACKRCHPESPASSSTQAVLVTGLCRLLERAEPTLGLRDAGPQASVRLFAAKAGLSALQLRRAFKQATGLTPLAYAAAQRGKRVRASLGKGTSITGAFYEAGFNSGGRFYEHSDKTLGMTPSAFRAGGAGVRIHFAVGECSLGSVLVAQSARGVCAILLGDDPTELLHDLERRFPKAELFGGETAYEQTVAAVVHWIDRPAAEFKLPLDIRGTAFQQRVWKALLQIPPGSTLSYAELAKRIGMPQATRAMAGACAANALAVAIPCHRVVRSDGSLSGYRWGIERKRTLLEREAEPRATLLKV